MERVFWAQLNNMTFLTSNNFSFVRWGMGNTFEASAIFALGENALKKLVCVCLFNIVLNWHFRLTDLTWIYLAIASTQLKCWALWARSGLHSWRHQCRCDRAHQWNEGRMSYLSVCVAKWNVPRQQTRVTCVATKWRINNILLRANVIA